MAFINWIPKYIREIVARMPRHVVTATEYNDLFNKLIDQGDHNAEAIADMRDVITDGDLIMGEGTSVNWGSIYGMPDQWPGSLSWDKILECIRTTYIDANGVWTPNVYAQNINTLYAKIMTAQIEHLKVGVNVEMDPDANINWGSIVDRPTEFGLTEQEVNALIASGTLSQEQIEILIANGVSGLSEQEVEDIVNTIISNSDLASNTDLQNLAFQWADEVLALITSTYIDANGVWTPNVYTNHIVAGTALIQDALIQSLDADKITGNIGRFGSVIVTNITSEKGYIASLTVDQLDTSDKVQHYLDGDTSDVYYTRIYGQITEEVEAQYNSALPPVHISSREGNLLYWIDGTFVGMTETVTEFPVYQYAYTEYVKKRESFVDDPDSTFLIPQTLWGVGTGVGNRGKAIWEKRQDGMYMTYTARGSGSLAADTELAIAMTDDGLVLPGFNVSTALPTGAGITYVGTDFPANAPNGSTLIDTDDFARHIMATAATTCNVDARLAEFFEFTGSSAYTATILTTGLTPGCNLRLINSGTAVVTLSATINGSTTQRLFPQDALDLEWNGTDWRIVGSSAQVGLARMNYEGGFMVKLINKTGANSVKGHVVTTASGTDHGVSKIVENVPTPIGVFYESGIADGAYAWVVVSGRAEVYFIGSTTRGHVARGFITGDTGYVTGQALSEAAPTTPFASDKHFYEIGHVNSARTGAGLAWVILHFN